MTDIISVCNKDIIPVCTAVHYYGFKSRLISYTCNVWTK